MKNFILAIMLVCTVGIASAQNQGLSFLKGQNMVNIVINYDNAILGQYDGESINANPDWERGQYSVYEKLVESFNDKMGKNGPTGGSFTKAPYTIEVVIMKVTNKGDTDGYFNVLDPEGKVLYKSKVFDGDGGRIGSFINLMGDGFEEFGKNMAKIVKSEMKK